MRSKRIAGVLSLAGLASILSLLPAFGEELGPTSRPASTAPPATQPDANDKKILDAIVLKHDPKLAMTLIKQAAEGDVGRSKGRDTALYYAVGAVKGNMLNVAEELVNRGANVNSRGIGGFTPLHEACYAGGTEEVAFLISKGADINAVEDISGDTPLHVMTICRCREPEKIFDLLLAHGANINAVDKKGMTPLDLARSESLWDKFDIAKLLEAKGTKTGKELKSEEIQHN